MTDAGPTEPQLYLVTPPVFETADFADILGACLDACAVGCVRLAMASRDMEAIGRAADALREVCHARDVALVIESHLRLVEPFGLDGVHLTDGSRSVRAVRKELGVDAILGAFCGASRHDAMTAGELGADYVSFGPVGETPLGTAERAPLDLFEWWSEMIEVPVVAEGALDAALIGSLSPLADFIALGDEIWSTEAPARTLASLRAAFG